ncbi:MAG: 23S rRNA (guanosine(2251)-2'-O)-methyltransferase RlmB [Rickettsiales bacterium]
MAQKKHHRQSLPPKNNRGGSSHTTGSNYSGGHWVYGWHAVNAALANEERVVIRIIASPTAVEKLKLPKRKLPNPHIMEPRELDKILGAEAVHQGIAAEVKPLEPFMIDDIINMQNPTGPIVILDQVSDPHNVGAIMRTAAAYDAIAVVYPKDHSAPETPTMAKAASGALDIVKRIQVTNLATAMRELKDAGWWIIGLEGESNTLFSEIKFSAKTVIVLGAEGKGMRRLTADCCDERARLPMGQNMESLNVSNAAAIALYQLYLSRKTHG